MKHKYLLVFDGAGPWSRRMQELLLSGSTALKHESHGYQFFEMNFIPFVHYVPFNYSNLEYIVNFLSENDDLAKTIANRGESFATHCLTTSQIDTFLTLFLNALSDKVGPNVHARGNLINIEDSANIEETVTGCFSKKSRVESEEEKLLRKEFHKEERDLGV